MYLFNIFNTRFYFLQHIKPSYLIFFWSDYSSIYFFLLYSAIYSVWQHLFLVACFLLSLITFDYELTYLRTLSLRIFFESVPKINCSRVNVIFLPSFWEEYPERVTQITLDLGFLYTWAVWLLALKSWEGRFVWRLLIGDIYFPFHTKLRLRKSSISMIFSSGSGCF